MTATVAAEPVPGAVAVRPENRVNGFDVFSLPRVGVDVPFSPDCVRDFPLDLRRIASAKPYAYVSGDPLNMTDPSGLCPMFVPQAVCDAADAAAAAARAAASAAKSAGQWAVEHPGTIAGVVGVAAVIVGTGGAAAVLGGAALALSAAQGYRDYKAGDTAGMALDALSFIPGAAAEIGTLRAISSASRMSRALLIGGDLSSDLRAVNQMAGASNDFFNALRWSGPAGWASAGIGFLGGAFTMTEMTASGATRC